MSRMLRHKRKKALIYLVLIVIGAIAVFTIGFQLIINGSVFIANLFVNQSSIEQTNNQVLTEITIDEIPSATNSSELQVSGSTYNIDTLLIFLNDHQVKKISVSTKNEFDTLVTGLRSGENEIYFLGEIENSNTRKESSTYSIISKTTKPKLEISSPSDNSTTPQSEINITGNTDEGVYIRINGLPVAIGSAGGFNQSVRLSEGENKILISAEDEAGNTEELTLTVVYEK